MAVVVRVGARWIKRYRIDVLGEGDGDGVLFPP